ncbi:hypothetical protein V475_00820 [Sphingobium baderi LL03]|nr:hypothetical protein V475_00820 [Sphingobium baderi LL03]
MIGLQYLLRRLADHDAISRPSALPAPAGERIASVGRVERAGCTPGDSIRRR